MKALLLTACVMACSTAALASELAITDVSIVDTQAGALSQHRTVVIREGRIVRVGSDAPPPHAFVVSGSGKYLIPGLWDMVTHLSWTRASAIPALVANGITSVRDEGGDYAETAGWAAAVIAGSLLGPTIFQVGPMLNGKSFNRYQYALGSVDDARNTVRLLKFEGVNGLEIERRVPRDIYFALMLAAKESGLPVGGKVPIDVEPAEAARAGQATLDNLESLFDGRFRASHESNMSEAMDMFSHPGSDADALFGVFKQNGTAITPCLSALVSSLARNQAPNASVAHYEYVARSNRQSIVRLPPQEMVELKNMLPRLQAAVARLQSAGVVLLAGTDIAADRVPGFSLHDELDSFAAAGLTPLQVLQTATLNPAIVMKALSDYGTVQPGKIADLLLLDADPTRSSAALHRINRVILHGRLLDQAALTALLQHARAEAERD